jgi:hypothetical protein
LGPLTWAADGRYLLVSARDVTGSAGFGLLEFKAARPFAALASNWRTTDKLVTPSSSGEGVLAAAISPDGRSLAVLSNLGSSDYRLLTTSAGDLRLKKARKLPLFGCALAWRSDSQELALVAGDPTCAQASGMIFGVRPDNPRQLTMLALQGQDPSWQPLSLSPSSVGG